MRIFRRGRPGQRRSGDPAVLDDEVFKFPRRARPFPPIELRGASYRGRPTPILLPAICLIVDLLLDDLAHFFKRGETHRTFPSLVILVVFRRFRLEVDFEICLVEHFATGIQET